MRSRHLAAALALAVLLGGAAARAQAEAAPASPPQRQQPMGPAPVQLNAPPPNPLLAPPPPPPPAQALQTPEPKPRWVKPVTIALVVSAVGFAAASIAIISSGPTSDQSRVDLGAGLGGGFIVCALGGVIVGFVVH